MKNLQFKKVCINTIRLKLIDLEEDELLNDKRIREMWKLSSEIRNELYTQENKADTKPLQENKSKVDVEQDEFNLFDDKVLESRNNPEDLILCQDDIDEQTSNFKDYLISKGYNLNDVTFFMIDYYQNMKTTKENLKEFEKMEKTKWNIQQ